MAFVIRSFIASNGERISQLYSGSEPGFPMYYPTAFIARSVRLRATHETQKVYLQSIKLLSEWESRSNISLTERFQRREFLRAYEIDDLASHLRTARLKGPGHTISASKSNTYIGYAAKYIRWLIDEVMIDTQNQEVREMITAQSELFSEKMISKTGSKSAATQGILQKRLQEKSREQLVALWTTPYTKLFCSSDQGTRLRLIVMLRILYETGMRRGELLALKLKSFRESTGGEIGHLIIERNHNDEFDTRVHQPVAKTSGRIVPITPDLERQLSEYIIQYRAVVRNTGFDDEDSIFVTHRAGRGQGKPLSISNFSQALATLKKLFPKLGALHPHMLRHDWNYRFSKLADETKLSQQKESEIREILMGWAPGSAMALRYNRRHVQEQSLKYGILVAKDTQKHLPTAQSTLAEAKELTLIQDH